MTIHRAAHCQSDSGSGDRAVSELQRCIILDFTESQSFYRVWSVLSRRSQILRRQDGRPASRRKSGNAKRRRPSQQRGQRWSRSSFNHTMPSFPTSKIGENTRVIKLSTLRPAFPTHAFWHLMVHVECGTIIQVLHLGVWVFGTCDYRLKS